MWFSKNHSFALAGSLGVGSFPVIAECVPRSLNVNWGVVTRKP